MDLLINFVWEQIGPLAITHIYALTNLILGEAHAIKTQLGRVVMGAYVCDVALTSCADAFSVSNFYFWNKGRK